MNTKDFRCLYCGRLLAKILREGSRVECKCPKDGALNLWENEAAVMIAPPTKPKESIIRRQEYMMEQRKGLG